MNDLSEENGRVEEHYSGGDTYNVVDRHLDEHNEGDTSNVDVLEKLTKRGSKRKRRLFKDSLAKRNDIKMDQQRNKHSLKPPCKTTCKQKCTDKIIERLRKTINQQFWNLSKAERRMFILHSVEIKYVKRRRGEDKKKETQHIHIY